jgi:BarA-like signal transduction histidine kinase
MQDRSTPISVTSSDSQVTESAAITFDTLLDEWIEYVGLPFSQKVQPEHHIKFGIFSSVESSQQISTSKEQLERLLQFTVSTFLPKYEAVTAEKLMQVGVALEKPIYNKYFGWALLSHDMLAAIRLIVPLDVPIIDFGTGTGLIAQVLRQIAGYQVVAVDNFTHAYRYYYSEIVTVDETYEVPTDSALFLSWGQCPASVVASYIKRGGKYVIIIGEKEGGCTFNVNFMEHSPEFASIEYPALNFPGVNTAMWISVRK